MASPLSVYSTSRDARYLFNLTRFGVLAAGFLLWKTSDANAVPSFAEQTGQRCSVCHVGGLGPQLTAFGRQFKLGGYTLRSGPGFTIPLAGMVVASYLQTDKSQDSPPAPHYGSNDNFTIDQASIFLAGGAGSHFGGFSQFTYDGVGRSFAWDQLDLRATTHETIAGSSVLLGVDINNSPGVQDVWNTLPSWGFPYTSSTLAPTPAAGSVISGALAQRVVGTSVYAFWDSHLYTEAGVYWAPGRKTLSALGVDLTDGDALLKGGAPYIRVAYQHDYGDQNVELGAFGLFARLYPGGDTSANADRFDDLGIDASWQYLGSGDNVFQINARYIHEHQALMSSFALGNSANDHDTLHELHADISYYWHKMLGLTISPFDIWGSRDALLYADNRTMSPNSTGVIFQADYTPWGTDVSPLGSRFNVRLGVQYTLYTRFDGAGTNYDGLGRSASDNNTLRLFTWFEF
jgi:hypothetical protein